MVIQISTKNAKYRYLVITVLLHESETGQWAALFERDKTALSKAVYALVSREMPNLMKSAGKRMPRNSPKGQTRKLYLLALPEYEAEIRFIQNNNRRPAFRDHLKKLILHGEEACSIPAAKPADQPVAQQEKQLDAASRMGRCLQSPKELFHDPNKLIQTMLAELTKPETERFFDWGDIQPGSYPESVRQSPLFVQLEEYWSGINKNSTRC